MLSDRREDEILVQRCRRQKFRVQNSGVEFINLSRFLYCMKLVDLKEEHVVEIVRLYEEHFSSPEYRLGFSRRMHMSPQDVVEDIKKHHGYQEYRLGSRWDAHSKLYFDTDPEGNVGVRFNSNFDPRDRQGEKYKEAEEAGEQFVNAAMQYLNQQ